MGVGPPFLSPCAGSPRTCSPGSLCYILNEIVIIALKWIKQKPPLSLHRPRKGFSLARPQTFSLTVPPRGWWRLKACVTGGIVWGGWISRGFAVSDGSAFKSHSNILQRLRRQISLDYYTIPPATQARRLSEQFILFVKYESILQKNPPPTLLKHDLIGFPFAYRKWRLHNHTLYCFMG